MTHVICRALVCVFWEQGACSAEEIEYEPDAGCLTFQDLSDLECAEEAEQALDWEEEDDILSEEDETGWDDGQEWEEDI